MWDAHNKDLNMELNAGNRRQPCMRHSIVNVGPRFSVYLHDTVPASLAASQLLATGRPARDRHLRKPSPSWPHSCSLNSVSSTGM